MNITKAQADKVIAALYGGTPVTYFNDDPSNLLFQEAMAIMRGLAEDAEPVKPSIFARMTDGTFAESQALDAIEEILGIELASIGFDDYDSSIEIYPDGTVADVAPTPEQHAKILALGCSQYWINFPDATQRYGTGKRVESPIARWKAAHAATSPQAAQTEAQERGAFEAWAGRPMGFNLTRQSIAVPEPWAEYKDESTGYLWAGWLGRAGSKP